MIRRMTIRPATALDWPRVGALSELLVATHHEWDSERFISAEQLRGDVYTSRVREHVADGTGIVLVADEDGRVVGFVFVGVEPESWKELRTEAGYIHDLVVDLSHRRAGIGAALLQAALEWFHTRGVTRVMLWTAPQNVHAQTLFHRFGFRTTMMEMTRGVIL